MQVLYEVHNGRVGWYDAHKRVMWLHAFAPWTWDEVHDAIVVANEHINSVPHDVTIVFYLEGDGNRMDMLHALQGIRRLIAIPAPPNCKQTLIATTNQTLKSFADAVQRLNPLFDSVDAYLYFLGKEDALKYLEQAGVLKPVPHTATDEVLE